MPLPDAILQAWDSAIPGRIGGLMELAGVDPEIAFLPKAIREHPWLGLEVKFPFAEVGKGKISRCLIHPGGQLMSDVTFPKPVPPIHGIAPHFQVVLKDNPVHHQTVHRFFGYELKAMLERKEKRESRTLSMPTTAGKRKKRQPRRQHKVGKPGRKVSHSFNNNPR